MAKLDNGKEDIDIEDAIDRAIRSIRIVVDSYNDYGGGSFVVKLMYDGEVITSDTLSLYSLKNQLENEGGYS